MKFLEYKVGSTIGEGTFGKVKIGTFIPTGEKVAIKILNKTDFKRNEEERKKIVEDMEKIRVLKAKQKIYRDALKRIQKDNEQEDLSDFIQKVKEEAEKISPIVHKEVSVADYLSDFLTEVLLLMRFDHPNIIKTYKVIESGHDVYIIMQYAEGGELSDHITKKGKLDEEEARRIFRQLLAGIYFIHASNVAHRDLKLENVLLDDHGNALISDFGLGKQFKANEMLKTFCGTPLYASPEIVRKMPYDGRKSDIWALGVILYSMTAGTLPFDGKTMDEVHFGILKGQFEIPEHFSWELSDLLRKIFVIDPIERPDIASIMETRWVNMGYADHPLKLTPPKINKDNLAKAISSVSVDVSGNTVYSIHAHRQLKLQKQIAAFEVKQKSSNSSLSKLKRKKNIVTQQSTDSVSKGDFSEAESQCNSPNLASSPSSTSNSSSSLQKFPKSDYSIHMANTPVLVEASREFSESLVPEPKKQLQVPQKPNTRRSFDKIPSSNTNGRNRSASCGISEKKPMESTSEPQHERELSIVRRMTSISVQENEFVSAESVAEKSSIEFNEINDWHLIHKPPKEIRTKKVFFKKGLTATLDPPSMFQDLHKALIELKQNFTDLKFTRVEDYYIFRVMFNTDNPILVDVELCISWFTNNRGLRIKQVQGEADTWICYHLTGIGAKTRDNGKKVFMKLSNYEVGKTIGEGAFGKVKLGKHIPTGEKVAIKIINIQEQKKLQEENRRIQTVVDLGLERKARKKIYSDAIEQIMHNPDLNGQENLVNLEEFMKKVRMEAKEVLHFEKEPSVGELMSNMEHEVLLLMRLSHPNIIKIFKVVETNDDIYIIMEYASGGDLSSYVGRYGQLTEIESRRIFRQIVSAVDFIHSSHVVHRDLKLENILLDHQNNVLVSDFGLSRAFGQSDHMKTFCGTPFYSAPELLGGKPYSGTKCDIWAMGVILFVMAAGFLPFASDSESKLLERIRTTEFEVPQHFSWELLDLLRKIFIENPQERLDIEGIRYSRWVNIGQNSKPLQIQPQVINKGDLAKMISSVTHEGNSTVYNINIHQNHTNEANTTQFERVRQKSASLAVADIKRKKSISIKQNPDISISIGSPGSSSKSVANTDNESRSLQVTSINRNLSVNDNLSRLSVADHNLQRLLVTNSIDSPGLKRSRTAHDRLSQVSLSNSGRNSPVISREASFVGRMSQVSLSSTNDIFSFKEISEWHLMHKPPKKIRTMKINFRKGLISSVDPPTMFQDLHRVLVEIKNEDEIKISKPEDYYMFLVHGTDFILEIELCKIWLLRMHGLRIKQSGNAEEMIKKLIDKLHW
ncbi:hypothetical protein HDV06_006932 [Boothiomyces sp. JEL0866]|nr:hypothetical protein HDV06_006932 [Boothiomyces sp. JEL0866]